MSRLLSVASVLLLALTVGHAPVLAQDDDLDRLDDATLQRDLEAELDDIYSDFDPDDEFALDDLKHAMLEALGDTGDDGDDAEEEISFAELEAEMEEADETLEEVIEEALAEADQLASSERQTGRVVRAGFDLGAAAQRRGNGRTTPRQATRQAVRSIIRVSNAR